jgi:hypothetical protein
VEKMSADGVVCSNLELSKLTYVVKIFLHPDIVQFNYCKIIYFCWDFISRFCHIVSLQQRKIRYYGTVVIENPLNICGFYFHDHNTLAKIKPTQK